MITKAFLVPAAATAVLLLACAAQPTAEAAPQASITTGRLMAPERVADGIWIMRQPDRVWAAVIGNVMIVEQADGIVLFDSGGSIADGRDIARAVAALSPKPIKAVVVSHWHNDHPLGVAGVLERYPDARVIATAATAEAMKSRLDVGVGAVDTSLESQRQRNNATRAQLLDQEAADPNNPAEMRQGYSIEAEWVRERSRRQVGSYVVLPNETFTDRLLLADSERPVELLFLGAANTAGDAVAWLPRQKIVATGDMVVLPSPYGFTVSVEPWLAALDRLEALPFEVLVPGHGKVQRGRDYLTVLRWSMDHIRSRAAALAGTDATADEAWERFDRSAHQARFGLQNEWDRYWLDRYWLRGMFDTAFKEARGKPAAPG